MYRSIANLTLSACLLAGFMSSPLAVAQQSSAEEPMGSPSMDAPQQPDQPTSPLQGQLDITQQAAPPVIQPVGEAPPIINFEPYIQQVHRQIRDHWQPVASDNDRYCRITAWFDVDKTGQISHLRVTEPCDDQRQNDAAIAAIQHAAPFQPLPDGYPGQFIELQYMFYSTPTASPPAGGAIMSDTEEQRDRDRRRHRNERRSQSSSFTPVAMPLFGFWW